MSLNHSPKCITKNDSNIPVPKSSGGKKSQSRSQFPELQKYIETIIRASNAYDSEDFTAKGEKPSKSGKPGINATQNEYKKLKKRQFNLNLNSERMNERSKTTVSVSSRENISNQFYADFENPRNWEIVATQNDFQKNIKIEKALKNLFPNPYKLLQTPEFSKSKISMYVEKITNDDATLSDVIISEIDVQKSLESASIKTNLEADSNKSSSQTNFQALNSSSRVIIEHVKTSDGCSISSFSDGITISESPSFLKNSASDKSTNAESIPGSFENLRNKDSIRREKKEEREKFQPVRERRVPKIKRNSKEPLIDYDIGKLKLLAVSDSDDSSKDMSREKDIKSKEDTKNRINSNKSSPDDKNQLQFSRESRAVKENLNDTKHKVNQTERKSRGTIDREEQQPIPKYKSKWKKSVKNSTRTQMLEGGSNDGEEPKLKPTALELQSKEPSKSKDEGSVQVREEIDEVLQFMCDCLKKFNSKCESVDGHSLAKTDSTGTLSSDKWPELDKPPLRKSKKSDQDLEATNHLGVPQDASDTSDSKGIHLYRASRSEKRLELGQLDQLAIRAPEVPDRVYPDSVAINNETVVHTVEIQNELGGFTEEQHQRQMLAKDTRLTKSVLPLSVKMKKTNTDTYQVLKNALEREEKLLNGEFSLNELSARNNFLQNPVALTAKESHSSCSLVGTFKRPHSNFVICVNSLSSNMRTRIPRSFSLCPWTISLNEIQRAYLTDNNCKKAIQPLPYYQNLYVEEFKFNGSQVVTKQARKDETVVIKYRSTMRYVTTWIGVSLAMEFLKVINETPLKSSESQIISKCRPIKKSFYVKPTTPPRTIGCKIETCQKVEFDLTSNLDNQVEALEEAVEETEKVYSLERNSGATYTISETSTLSKNETFRNVECNDNSEKRKLHDLLMRTNDLQQKIQQHLKKLSDRPTCPAIQQEAVFDFGVTSKNSEVLFEAVDKMTKDGIVYWYLQTPPKSIVLDEAVSVEVPKTDKATSYDPPILEELKNISENEDSGDDDDQSSTYSFKSSIDFSEYEKELAVLQPKENTKHSKFLKNATNEINTAKNRLVLEKEKERETETKADEKKGCTGEELTVSSESTKTSTKLLTTVFKGKESLTELSLGLKAIPFAKVNNISVEKRKISENHTKISIAISKETANEFLQDQRTKKDMMCSRLSYYLNSIRPSLSSSQSVYSRAGNGFRLVESEDEDDYKSVLSSFTRNSEHNPKNQVEELKKVEMAAPKSIKKYRFDFYKKMDTSNKMKQKSMSNASCSYKEFEPLKQALTEMQIRMRSIKKDAYFSSNDYYQRALRLAKMSAGYCQSCGSRAVIPQDTFGYYNTILPRNRAHCHKGCHLRVTHPKSSYYSLQSSFTGLSDQFCDRDLRESPSYLMNPSRTIIRN